MGCCATTSKKEKAMDRSMLAKGGKRDSNGLEQ